MKITLVLAAITVGFYFVFSNALAYIPYQVQLTYGFSFANWLGLVTYTFVHVAPAHLVGNVLLFLVVGIIAETALRPKDFLAIYFLSGAAAAIIFCAVQPNTVLVGASAAIAGIMIAAILIDMKKAAVFIVGAFLVTGIVVIPALNSAISGWHYELNKSATQLKAELNKTEAEKNETLTLIIYVEQQYNAGNISPEEYNLTVKNLSTVLQNITETEKKVNESLNLTAGAEQNIAEGKKREAAAKTSIIIHLTGILAALGYLLAFRRDIIWKVPYQFSMFGPLPRKSKKKSRKRR
jgi:hypothetical protein